MSEPKNRSKNRERPERTAQMAYLHLMWCAWMNVSWDDLDADGRRAVVELSRRVVDVDLPALAGIVYGVDLDGGVAV